MKLKSFQSAIKIAAALAFTMAAGSALAAHQLQIKLDGVATRSLFVIGDPQWQQTGSRKLTDGICIGNPSGGFPKGWYNPNLLLKDGSKVKVIAFSSYDCTWGYRRDKQMTVPGNDRLGNVYLPLF